MECYIRHFEHRQHTNDCALCISATLVHSGFDLGINQGLMGDVYEYYYLGKRRVAT